MPRGTIGRLLEGSYGFIRIEGERDVFFHRNDLQGVAFNMLNEGQDVEFEMGQGRDGRPRAIRVRLVQPEGQ